MDKDWNIPLGGKKNLKKNAISIFHSKKLPPHIFVLDVEGIFRKLKMVLKLFETLKWF